MAKSLNVLYGFKSEKIEKSLTKELALRGYEVRSTMRPTKDLIKDFVKNHPELDVVFLKEFLDGGGVYSPRELTELVDDAAVSINVVMVIATSHRGKPEMRELYAAGILNVFFSDGKFGANTDRLADLAVKSRTRRQAREYYRINEIVPDHINLTYEQFRDNYRYLVDNSFGANIIDRFVEISRMLYPGQMGAFIDDMPDRAKEILMQYREFYDIANKMYRMGMSRQKYPVPKNIKRGLTKEAMQEKLKKDSNKKPFEEVKLQPVQSVPDDRKPVAEAQQEEAEKTEEVQEVERKRPEKPKKKRGLFGRRKKGADEEEVVKSLFDEVGVDAEGVGAEEIRGLDDMRRDEKATYESDGYYDGEPAAGQQEEEELPDRADDTANRMGAGEPGDIPEKPVPSAGYGKEEEEDEGEEPLLYRDGMAAAGAEGAGIRGDVAEEIDYSKLSIEEIMKIANSQDR